MTLLTILVLLALYIGCKQKWAVYNVNVTNFPKRRKEIDVIYLPGNAVPGNKVGTGLTSPPGVDDRFTIL